MSFLVGGIVVFAIGIIPVVGGVVAGIAGLVGLGAIMLRALALRRETQPV
jgi:hypothetical protein